MQFFIATYSSRHYEFEAFGMTEGEARKALVKGLHKHAKQCGISRNWWHPSKEYSDDPMADVFVREATMGGAQRDRQDI